VTDRRTDRQTDRILITIPRLHYMQRGKNWSNCGCFWMYYVLPCSHVSNSTWLFFTFYFRLEGR